MVLSAMTEKTIYAASPEHYLYFRIKLNIVEFVVVISLS